MYNKWIAYGQSKTANILFSVELAQRLGSKGLKAFALHPGAIQTNIGRSADNDDFEALRESLMDWPCTSWRGADMHCADALDRDMGHRAGFEGFKWKNLARGTATYVVAAFDPKLDGESPCPRVTCISSADNVSCQSTMGRTCRIARFWHLMRRTCIRMPLTRTVRLGYGS